MSRFRRLKENEDEKALRKDIKVGSEELDELAINVFSNNFFSFQGLSDEYSLLLDLKHELALLQLKYLSGDGRHFINQIRSKEAQIKEQNEKLKSGMSIKDAKTFIEEKMKLLINLDEISVEDFYSKLEYYGRRA